MKNAARPARRTLLRWTLAAAALLPCAVPAALAQA